MNWFERYGIVGMFFIAMTAMWFFCLFPDSRILFNKENEVLVKYVVGICGLSFLPIGYILMISAQLFYYRIGNKESIHCEQWENLPSEMKKKIQTKEKKMENGLKEEDQEDEAKIEAILTYYDRKYIEPVEINQFLSTFATKRYDVISINRGLQLAIILSLVFAVCLNMIIVQLILRNCPLFLIGFQPFSAVFASIVAILLMYILWRSINFLEKQILEIGKRKLRDIELK